MSQPKLSSSSNSGRGTFSNASLRNLLNKPWAGVGVLLVFYVALMIIFSVLSPFFLSTRNLLSIGNNMAFIGLMAATQTLLIIAGGMDLSVAAIAGLSGVIVGLLAAAGWSIWLACLVALLVAAGIGWINGFFVTRVGINALIATLGMLSICEGVALVLTGGLTKPLLSPGFTFVGSGRILGVPLPLIVMVIAFVALSWVLARTRFGRFVYATGGNKEASRLSGVPVNRVLTRLFVLSGVSGAVSGLVLAAMLRASAPTAASDSILTVIAAVILGGTSLYGGRGSIWGTLLAVLILGTLNNGLVLLNVSSFWQDVTQGVVLLLAVGLDQLRTRVMGS